MRSDDDCGDEYDFSATCGGDAVAGCCEVGDAGDTGRQWWWYVEFGGRGNLLSRVCFWCQVGRSIFGNCISVEVRRRQKYIPMCVIRYSG